jgi:hypothetical protein
MKLRYFDATTLDRNLKATVHKSGKLGFTIEAAKKMKLDPSKSVVMATNEDEPDDNNLYAIVHGNSAKGAFPVRKGGQYYYINTKPLFDLLKINYVKEFVQYAISEMELEGETIYKLSRKEKESKSSPAVKN